MRPVALLVLTLALGGCGGGGGERLSRAEYQQQGNAICAKYERQIDAVPDPQGRAGVAKYVDTVVPLAEKQLDELRDLKPPEEDQDAHDEMLEQAERVVDAARDLKKAVADNDDQAAQQAVARGNSASGEADAIAKDLGLDTCTEED